MPEILPVQSAVVIQTPENARLHGTEATVAAWLYDSSGTVIGYHLYAPAAATGAFRALFEEVYSLTARSDKVDDGKKRQQAIASGFTGNACDRCGSLNMVRDGKCERCDDCGSTAGGCA